MCAIAMCITYSYLFSQRLLELANRQVEAEVTNEKMIKQLLREF